MKTFLSLVAAGALVCLAATPAFAVGDRRVQKDLRHALHVENRYHATYGLFTGRPEVNNPQLQASTDFFGYVVCLSETAPSGVTYAILEIVPSPGAGYVAGVYYARAACPPVLDNIFVPPPFTTHW